MNVVLGIILLYIAICIVFILHEIGHFGRKIHFNLGFPLPNAWSEASSNRIGGLMVNLLIMLAVWYYKPELFFLQLIGAVAWAHFILYAIFGSFNYEPRIPLRMSWLYRFIVLDDVPNEYWYLFVPLALVVLFYFQSYYLPVFIQLFVV